MRDGSELIECEEGVHCKPSEYVPQHATGFQCLVEKLI